MFHMEQSPTDGMPTYQQHKLAYRDRLLSQDMTIHEMSAASGVSQRTIRNWADEFGKDLKRGTRDRPRLPRKPRTSHSWQGKLARLYKEDHPFVDKCGCGKYFKIYFHDPDQTRCPDCLGSGGR